MKRNPPSPSATELRISYAATLGNRHTHAVQGCYPCDGVDRWINITLYDESDWRAFCDAIGSPEWTTQTQFATRSRRYANQDALDAHIAEWTQRRAHYEALRLLQADGVAAGPVMDQRDAFAAPRLKARGIFRGISWGCRRFASLCRRVLQDVRNARPHTPRTRALGGRTTSMCTSISSKSPKRR